MTKRDGDGLPVPNAKRVKTDAEDSAEKLKSLQDRLNEKLKQLDEKIGGNSDLNEADPWGLNDPVPKKVVGILKKKKNSNKTKKSVKFTMETKTEDGNTARMYSRPEFLKAEGGYLRPKSKEEIAEGIRQGIINDCVRTVQLTEDESDTSEDEEYDPTKPNNYEQYCRDLVRKEKRAGRRRQEAALRLEKQKAAEKTGQLHMQELQKEDALEAAQLLNSRISPKADKKKKKVSNFAKRAMEKMGWKKGEGLGAKGQGIKGCLAPGRNNAPTMVMDTSRILRLQNMVGPGNVDNELRSEVGNECSKFGRVLNVIVHETKKKVQPEHAVNVFVEFLSPEICEFAIQAFNGRFFGGRTVLAAFFPEERYVARDLDP